jgi:predicted N-formylglutamate amidohydrolase
MPRPEQALEDLDLAALGISRRQFVISVEHASNRIPAGFGNLGLTSRQLDSHIAWDPGARTIARVCAKALACACHEGRYSRLLVDLNRSLGHPKLIARRSFSIAIPGNAELSPDEKISRIQRYYAPFREAVLNDVRRAVERYERCVHLSIHSFTPAAGRIVRNADIGLLYDPQRPLERLLADGLADRLSREGFHVRRNYPYRGVSDGHTTHLRSGFPKLKYAGLEIEVNQRLLRSHRGVNNIAGHLAHAAQSLAGESSQWRRAPTCASK